MPRKIAADGALQMSAWFLAQAGRIRSDKIRSENTILRITLFVSKGRVSISDAKIYRPHRDK